MTFYTSGVSSKQMAALLGLQQAPGQLSYFLLRVPGFDWYGTGLKQEAGNPAKMPQAKA